MGSAMKTLLRVALLLASAGCLGCEAAPPADSTATAVEAPAPPPPAEAAGASSEPAPPAATAPVAAPAAAAPHSPAAAAPAVADAAAPAKGDSVKKAEVGVGVKGRDYGGPGFVTTPIETLFRTDDRIAFEIQIPKAMSIYKAGHDNKGPKTHEEFMNVIIKEHAVILPDLPPGSTYWYDAKAEELMVKTPKPE
jgi:hypothetical protein